ncbi:MAG: UDP-N-acetylmuramoyl-L-alanine--D-glutamate ligase [Thermodesulfobacterium geofontis]|uniref:UDP-N-acetylmuramoylalanine--D-glutamate ligase n=1 Tax=Thermodesulfobacterium geofontis TaxID=1295609 RepID=A0A2N7PN98_9BACT|nr:MAG: UDP-N-acetylmuramoyl-L-alanine--D-glutamate ligase [Thermodesulfobacterium geofontis]
MELKNKKVVVLGFGKSGKAVTKLLLKQGAEVIVSEIRELDELPPDILTSFKSQGVYFEGGGHKKETLLSADLIVTSPGVPREVYKDCIKKGIPVLSELELAWQFLKNKKEIIAITGTNGKTTTTAMVSELLKLSEYKVFTGGNYGIPLSELAVSNVLVDKIVLEVSSFQLENICTFSPKVGILLNISPDHLERYSSYEEYAYYKYRLFEYQKENHYAILPFGEPWFEKFKKLIKSKVLFFDEKENIDAVAYLKPSSISSEDGFILNLKEKEFYSFFGFKLLGIHNKVNFMVASLGARLLSATKESVKRLIKEFRGFPHRLEYIGEFGGVYFINDSKATNVSATLQALKSLPNSIILILGGKHKGASYSPLIPYIKEKVKILILMGESRFIMAEELEGITETYMSETLSSATLLAIKLAKPGDIVLLSPACSSFDQFADYKERGEVFRRLVIREAPLHFKEKKEGIFH